MTYIRLFQMRPSNLELVRSNSLGVEDAEARVAKKTSVVGRSFMLTSEVEMKGEKRYWIYG